MSSYHNTCENRLVTSMKSKQIKKISNYLGNCKPVFNEWNGERVGVFILAGRKSFWFAVKTSDA